tara:strand:- start:10257 stop:10433 length:177 start_codon:yes stop_codon:yes gene_type:complete
MFKAIGVDVDEIMVGDVTDPVAVARAIKGCAAGIEKMIDMSSVRVSGDTIGLYRLQHD